MNKFLYHGSFATLGIGLLLGMAVLQVNGRKAPDDLLTGDTAAAIVDTPADTAVSPAPAPAVEAQVAMAPTSVSAGELPAASVTSAPVVTPKPVVHKATKAMDHGMAHVSLDTAQAFSIFNARHKNNTKKTFSSTPNGLRNALSYLKKVGHPSIKAQMSNGSWASVSVQAFKKYAADNE